MNFTRTVGSFTSPHLRAITTGTMIKSAVEGTADSIGYAFWSAGNFSSATYGTGGSKQLKYLTVDGVDPLFAAYSTSTPGEIPTTAALLNTVTLQNVVNGSYPIWSELRFVSLNTTTTGYATTLASYATLYDSWTSGCTTTCGSQPDFVPAASLNVERAHFGPLPGVTDAYTPSQGPRVCGSSSGAIEAGGDAGGIVTTLQAGSDFAVLKGNYGTSSCVGITNAASFGVHQ